MVTIRNCSIAVLAFLFLADSRAAQPQRCTLQTVVGTCVLAYDGTVITPQMPVPVAGLSIVTIDSQGDVSAPGYISVGGMIQWYPIMPGTMTVNADCTGEINWKDDQGQLF